MFDLHYYLAIRIIKFVAHERPQCSITIDTRLASLINRKKRKFVTCKEFLSPRSTLAAVRQWERSFKIHRNYNRIHPRLRSFKSRKITRSIVLPEIPQVISAGRKEDGMGEKGSSGVTEGGHRWTIAEQKFTFHRAGSAETKPLTSTERRQHEKDR